jgi:hypothetical protein
MAKAIDLDQDAERIFGAARENANLTAPGNDR